MAFGLLETTHTQLQGASLDGAQLQGALIEDADLEAASLDGANLEAASLNGANLKGTLLRSARLQGASLHHAQLQGSWLDNAQLQGALLEGAELQGAWLAGTELQGASLKEAQLEGAWLENVFVWRTDARTANWKGAHVTAPETGLKYSCTNNENAAACDWTPSTFGALKRQLANEVSGSMECFANRRWLVPDEELSKSVGEELQTLTIEALHATMTRIEPSLDPSTALNGEVDMAKDWAGHERSSRATMISRDTAAEQWMKTSAEQWREAGCAAGGAPYVARALLARTEMAFFPKSPEASKVALVFLDTEHCPGARGLSGAEIAKLKAIRDRDPVPKR